MLKSLTSKIIQYILKKLQFADSWLVFTSSLLIAQFRDEAKVGAICLLSIQFNLEKLVVLVFLQILNFLL